MTVLYAQPYNISALGFSFEDEAEYHEKAKKNFDGLGFPIEEYEIPPKSTEIDEKFKNESKKN